MLVGTTPSSAGGTNRHDQGIPPDGNVQGHLRNTEADIQAALATCRQRWMHGVRMDPLGYPEFDDPSLGSQLHASTPVEVEFTTRAKASGAVRLEVALDCVTSIQLELVAQQLRDRLGDVAARSGSRESNASKPYEQWSETIPTWIRRMLVDGKTIVVADIRDYFPSIRAPLVERALVDAGLCEQDVAWVTDTIRDINAVPDDTGETRSGLPVAEDDLFWQIADLILQPVDRLLTRNDAVAGHFRWVDDFYIAVEQDMVRQVLGCLSTAVEAMGLKLNEGKTRVIDDIAAFDRDSLTAEHRIVTSLMMTSSSRSPLSRSQTDAFTRLTERDRVPTPDDARLWKRVYALATRIRSPSLARSAIDDLTLFPTVTAQVSSYLSTIGWPSASATDAARQLAHRGIADTQAISLVQGFLDTQAAVQGEPFYALAGIAMAPPSSLHPYALALVNTCLVTWSEDHLALVRPGLWALAANDRSPMARRVAIQLLWREHDNRAKLAERIARDPSYAVRDLAFLPHMPPVCANRANAITGALLPSRLPASRTAAGSE